MNKQTKIAISIFTIILFMVGCQSDINQPNEPLTYNGIVVSESTPDFTNGKLMILIGILGFAVFFLFRYRKFEKIGMLVEIIGYGK